MELSPSGLESPRLTLYHYLEIVRAPLTGEPVFAYHWWIVLGCTVVGTMLALLAMKLWRARIAYWV